MSKFKVGDLVTWKGSKNIIVLYRIKGKKNNGYSLPTIYINSNHSKIVKGLLDLIYFDNYEEEDAFRLVSKEELFMINIGVN